MKVSEAVNYCLEYHRMNSSPNTVRAYEFVLSQFSDFFEGRKLDSITPEEALSFLTKITEGKRQATKKSRHCYLSSFFNFINSAFEHNIPNPCDARMIKKIFKAGRPAQRTILEKDVVDEMIFRIPKVRNRLLLELMARGGMRVGEVLNLTAADVQDQRLIIQNPKSGKESEVVFIPRKIAERLRDYIREKGIQPSERIFPITYPAARMVVVKAGKVVGVKVAPHDLRRHAATYASRSGTPIEIVSKVILRHSNLATTQQYLGKVSDVEALRWIENLHG